MEVGIAETVFKVTGSKVEVTCVAYNCVNGVTAMQVTYSCRPFSPAVTYV